MLVKVDSFIFLVDFVILYYELDYEVPIILEKSFLAIGRTLVDMEKRKINFRLNNEEATFNICRSIKKSCELQMVSTISFWVESMSKVKI